MVVQPASPAPGAVGRADEVLLLFAHFNPGETCGALIPGAPAKREEVLALQWLMRFLEASVPLRLSVLQSRMKSPESQRCLADPACELPACELLAISSEIRKVLQAEREKFEEKKGKKSAHLDGKTGNYCLFLSLLGKAGRLRKISPFTTRRRSRGSTTTAACPSISSVLLPAFLS